MTRERELNIVVRKDRLDVLESVKEDLECSLSTLQSILKSEYRNSIEYIAMERIAQAISDQLVKTNELIRAWKE